LVEPDDVDLAYELLVSAATVYEKQFQDRLRAIEFLVRALDFKPNDVPVLERLNGLYRAEHQWPELLENLRVEASVAETVEARAKLHRDMGQLLATKMENHPDALLAYQRVLEEIPSDPQARAAVRS